MLCSETTRANSFKLKRDRFRLDIMKEYFYNEGGETLEQVTQRMCGFLITGSARSWFGQSFAQPDLVKEAPAHSRGLEKMISKGSVQPKPSYDSKITYIRLQKSKQLRTHGNSPYHSFKQVVNDEVRLGNNNQQRHMGPSKLEEKTACSPACLKTLLTHVTGTNLMLLAISQTENGSCTCAFLACTFTITNMKRHDEQGTVIPSNLQACSSVQAQS